MKESGDECAVDGQLMMLCGYGRAVVVCEVLAWLRGGLSGKTQQQQKLRIAAVAGPTAGCLTPLPTRLAAPASPANHSAWLWQFCISHSSQRGYTDCNVIIIISLCIDAALVVATIWSLSSAVTNHPHTETAERALLMATQSLRHLQVALTGSCLLFWQLTARRSSSLCGRFQLYPSRPRLAYLR